MSPKIEEIDVVGHEREIALIRRIAAGGVDSGSFLFCGPEGVGKKRAARMLAREFLCGSAKGTPPCGSCLSCREPLEPRATQAGHPDFTVLDSGEDASIGIDRARDFSLKTREVPLLAPVRIGLVDDAHRLTRQAANSLLKIVEEPPGRSVFIFVTSVPDKLPVTLRSRLLTIRFRPLPDCDLARIGEREFQKYSPEEIAGMIPFADGSAARLKALLSQAASGVREMVCRVLAGEQKTSANPSDPLGPLSDKEGFEVFLDGLERLLLSSERSLAGLPPDPFWEGSPLPRTFAGTMPDFRRGELHDRIGDMRRLSVHNYHRGLALERFLWDIGSFFASRSH